MVKIEFLQDFGQYKKKDKIELDTQLASRIIRRGKAKVYKPKKSKTKE